MNYRLLLIATVAVASVMSSSPEAQAQAMIMDPVPLGVAVTVTGVRQHSRLVELEPGDRVRLEIQSPEPGELIVFLNGMTPRGFLGSLEQVVSTRMRNEAVFEGVVRHGGQYFVSIGDGGMIGNKPRDFTYTLTVIDAASPDRVQGARQLVSSTAAGETAVAGPSSGPAVAASGAGAPSFTVVERFAMPPGEATFVFPVARRGDRIAVAIQGCDARYEVKILQQGFFAGRVRARATGQAPRLTFMVENDAPYYIEHKDITARPGDYFLLATWRADEEPSAEQRLQMVPNCTPLPDATLGRAFGPLFNRAGRIFVDPTHTQSQTYRWNRPGVLERLDSSMGSGRSSSTYYALSRRTGALHVVDASGWRPFTAAEAATLFTTPFSAEQYAEVQRRRAAEQARSRNETMGFIGAVVGILAVAVASEGTATDDQVQIGMAMGANALGAGSDIAEISGREMAAIQARQEEERRQLVDLVARINNPDDPVNREFREAEDRRRATHRAETGRLRQEQEQADAAAAAEARAFEQQRDAENASVAQQRQNDAAAAEAADRQRQSAEEIRQVTARRDAEARVERERQDALRRETENRESEERAAREREAQQRAAAAQRERDAAEAERNRLVDWPEAVTFCILRPNSRTEFRCDGPLQATYGTPGTSSYDVAVRQACGSDTVRSLGTTNGYAAWGCGFGLRFNAQNRSGAFSDPAARLGISYVPGRITFRCPPSTNNCRTR